MRGKILLPILASCSIASCYMQDEESESLPIIEVVGNKFFDSESGEQFFMKGIAYQPSRSLNTLQSASNTFDTKYIDPLADPNICLRDIPYLKELNINTVRVYSVDPNKPHDVCMNALANEGIYVLLDLAEPDLSIARDNPTWDVNLWRRYCDVIDSMHKYDNMLGFFAGNEVTNDKTNTDASPFVKAAIRDIKSYITAKGYREIPVGYSSNDDSDTRDSLAKFFACGEVSADFYGINMYEWCGYSSFGSSGYKDRTSEFKNYPIPVFFSEFGCNLVRPRPFTEVSALFGPKMTGVWSGGLAYMYFEEDNEYGVVKVDEYGVVEKLDDFDFLKQQFQNVQPNKLTKEEYLNSKEFKVSQKKMECPENNQFGQWEATDILPPTPNSKKCSCLEEVLPCLVLPFDDTERYKQYFDYFCGQFDCSDIDANGKNGQYGDFSSCNNNQKLSLQISKMYHLIGNDVNQCPITDKNVYFNIKSQKSSLQRGKCSEDILEEIKNAIASTNKLNKSPSKKTQGKNRSSLDNHGDEAENAASSNSSDTSTGLLILFMAAFVATILL